MSYFRYTTAIMRGIPRSLPAEAQRLDLASPMVSYEKASQQVRHYAHVLRELGLKVIELPADESQPDCVFVEDTVVTIGKNALITTPGHETRQSEIEPMANCLRKLGLNLTYMKEKNPDARMDGGDVLFTGEEIFVGISDRTNEAGLEVLRATFPEFPATSIVVGAGLHLKSACSLVKPGTVIQAVGTPQLKEMARNFQSKAKKKHVYIEICGKSIGANCLYIDSPKQGQTIVHQSYELFPESRKAYEALSGIEKIECDHSELEKVDGALTCCSVLLAI